MALRFHKMHGLGNDFIVVDAREQSVAMNSGRARALADRRTGIGCDQVVLIGSPGMDGADVSMRIWNADGSEVEACGNATRCVPVLLGRDARVATLGGLLHARLDADGAAVDMGRPRIDWQAIPLAYAMDTAALPLAWDDLASPAAVNVGNPHLVFVVPDIDAVPLETAGPTIEHDPAFPDRINVNVATVVARDHARMRTWERGVGLTQACGTGACAVFACGRRLGLLDAAARIDLPGGTLHLSEQDGRILMRGPAAHVFTGETQL